MLKIIKQDLEGVGLAKIYYDFLDVFDKYFRGEIDIIGVENLINISYNLVLWNKVISMVSQENLKKLYKSNKGIIKKYCIKYLDGDNIDFIIGDDNYLARKEVAMRTNNINSLLILKHDSGIGIAFSSMARLKEIGCFDLGFRELYGEYVGDWGYKERSLAGIFRAEQDKFTENLANLLEEFKGES